MSISQENEILDFYEVDSLYREDQLYLGVTFNLLSNKPIGFEQNGFSAGLQAGFIRDMPINKKRNKAIGIGAGIAIDTYNQNLVISEVSNNVLEYAILDDDDDTNRFTSYTLEFPLEYRWRTSTPEDYSFWRIHAGVKLGYVLSYKSTYESSDGDIIVRDLSGINRLQYGPTFSFGFGAFNFQAYYGLNPLFNDNAQIDGEPVNLEVLRLGLVFYFL